MSNAHAQVQNPFEEVALDKTERPSSDENSTASANQAETERAWGRRHPINIRVSIPLIHGRWFFTLIGGPERRNDERRSEERKKHPLLTLGNVIFLFIFGAVIGLGLAVLMVKETIKALSG